MITFTLKQTLLYIISLRAIFARLLAHFQNISISPVQPPLHLPSQQDQG